MNLTKFALAAVLSVSMAVPAVAQNYPDVPSNQEAYGRLTVQRQSADVPKCHWAYEAVMNLADRVTPRFESYPTDSLRLVRSNRPLNRHELAATVKELHEIVRGRVEGLEDQVDALTSKIAGLKASKKRSHRRGAADFGFKGIGQH